MFALVLLCCVAAIASLPPLDSGDANQATNISWIPLPTVPVSGPPLAAPRIINGRTAEPHAYPYQAALSCNRRFVCGGSVISDVHVVTAAHCVDSPGRCKVVLGSHDLKRKERSRQIIAVNETYIHPNYSLQPILSDIAILKLKKKIKFNKYVQPVNLPKTSPEDWMTLVYTGWGATAKDSGIETFSALQVATTKTLKDPQCKKFFPPIDDSVICVYSRGNSSCFGDSGGPYVYANQLFGIASFVAKGCNVTYPQGVVNVIHFDKWIRDVTGITSAANSLLPDLFIMLVAHIVVLKLLCAPLS